MAKCCAVQIVATVEVV